MKRNKFKAVRTNGFGSKFESAVYDLLKLRQLAGEIYEIKCQQGVTLLEGRKDVQIRWKIDFSFRVMGTDALEYAEAKGFATQDYKLKLRLYKSNPPAPLTIYMGSYRKIFIAERVEK